MERLLLALGALALIAAGPPLAGMDLAALDRTVREIAAQPTMEARLEAASKPFLGTPYLDSPLGEGFGADQDPRVRFDHVDCLTFVEMVMALANSETYLMAQMALDDIRYSDGAPAFHDRNHFMESQWLPQNQRKGYLVDITRKVGGEAVVVETKVVTRASWAARRVLKELDLPGDRQPLGTFTLPVIPLAEARRRIDRIPAGTLLSVARGDHYTFPGRITHVGLVMVRGGKRWLRHGARSVYGKVVDEPLEAFLARNGAYEKWPVVGIHLEEVLDNRARAAQIAGPRGK